MCLQQAMEFPQVDVLLCTSVLVVGCTIRINTGSELQTLFDTNGVWNNPWLQFLWCQLFFIPVFWIPYNVVVELGIVLCDNSSIVSISMAVTGKVLGNE